MASRWQVDGKWLGKNSFQCWAYEFLLAEDKELNQKVMLSMLEHLSCIPTRNSEEPLFLHNSIR